jgi:hypothetical protein
VRTPNSAVRIASNNTSASEILELIGMAVAKRLSVSKMRNRELCFRRQVQNRFDTQMSHARPHNLGLSTMRRAQKILRAHGNRSSSISTRLSGPMRRKHDFCVMSKMVFFREVGFGVDSAASTCHDTLTLTA